MGRFVMTPPGDAEWSVLQLDSDPVPGDPESFEEITRAYQELARTTQEAHDLLAFADAMRGLGSERRIFAANERVVTTEGVDVDGLLTDAGRPIATLAVQTGGKFKQIHPSVEGAS
jgi:hypothetical protein